MPPDKRNGAPAQGPAATISHRQAPDLPQGTARGVVHVVERTVSADFIVPDRRATAVLQRAVPARGREKRPGQGTFLVFGSHVERLVATLTEAGYTVQRTFPTASTARSASSS